MFSSLAISKLVNNNNTFFGCRIINEFFRDLHVTKFVIFYSTFKLSDLLCIVLQTFNFIAEDTMETASHFICKDCIQTLYEVLESPHPKAEGNGYL
jgi:hypothetical protein